MTGAFSRSKGQRGELIVAKLIAECTGWPVRRKVRQHDGDSDLEGIPNWAAEVKNHAAASMGDVEGWWAQTVAQANGSLPVLFYRRQRGEWRAVWPAAIQMVEQRADFWSSYEWTAETSVQCWAAVARELSA